jgi:hypothetical protein
MFREQFPLLLRGEGSQSSSLSSQEERVRVRSE